MFGGHEAIWEVLPFIGDNPISFIEGQCVLTPVDKLELPRDEGAITSHRN